MQTIVLLQFVHSRVVGRGKEKGVDAGERKEKGVGAETKRGDCSLQLGGFLNIASWILH